jgi:NAD(P)-dependent dehydrogenase (short-subunit alcohol dehydrogenase family)
MAQHTVIIGGTSGIGLATAHRLAGDGHDVTIAGRDGDRLKAALAELTDLPDRGLRAVRGVTVDATDRASLDALFAATGPVDNLVVTATAAGGLGPFFDLSLDDLLDATEGKLLAHLNAIQAAAPVLRAGGSVTLVSAGSAQAAIPGTVGLAAVNGAIETVVPVLAVEAAPRRVNAVSPGVIDTAWWDWLPATDRERTLAGFAKQVPTGRVGRAGDVADAIAFLIGNSYVTGAVIPVDGGLRLAPVG